MLGGKAVLISGGGTGVGAAMARSFAEAGATVWIVGRTEQTLAEISAGHDRIQHVVADVTQEHSVRDMFSKAGTIDIVIANAGASDSGPLLRTELRQWQRMIDVNLTGVFLTFREGLRQLQNRPWGRLIAVASTAGLKGYAYAAPYAAAKHGVVGLARSLALETAKKGITVNALCPGFLDTGMTARSIARVVEKTGQSTDQARAQLEGFNPQGRLIDPLEVSTVALWLCGPGSDAVNGQALAISGGEI